MAKNSINQILANLNKRKKDNGESVSHLSDLQSSSKQGEVAKKDMASILVDCLTKKDKRDLTPYS